MATKCYPTKPCVKDVHQKCCTDLPSSALCFTGRSRTRKNSAPSRGRSLCRRNRPRPNLNMPMTSIWRLWRLWHLYVHLICVFFLCWMAMNDMNGVNIESAMRRELSTVAKAMMFRKETWMPLVSFRVFSIFPTRSNKTQKKPIASSVITWFSNRKSMQHPEGSTASSSEWLEWPWQRRLIVSWDGVRVDFSLILSIAE